MSSERAFEMMLVKASVENPFCTAAKRAAEVCVFGMKGVSWLGEGDVAARNEG